MNDALSSQLQALLEQMGPHRLIGIGEQAASLLEGYARGTGAELVLAPARPPLPALEGLPYDLALVAGELREASAAELSVLLGRLRDLYARRIWVVLGAGGALGHRDLISHGFSRLGEYGHGGRTVRLYEFDIGTYKTTPDWLNSKHWANPKLFDKYRW